MWSKLTTFAINLSFSLIIVTFNQKNENNGPNKWVYNNTSNFGDNVGDVSEIKLTERQQKIINLIRQSPSVTAKQMSETLSVSSRTIERDLSALKEAGELMRDGKDNDGVWVIIKKNESLHGNNINDRLMID